MISLPQVTLISVSTREVEQAARALEYSCLNIGFGTVKLVSPYRPQCADYIQHDHIAPFATIDDWNRYIVYDLTIHVDTPYCLLVHPDGFVVNAHKWQDRFLDYDYIGPPWDMETSIAIQGGRPQELSRVGNSVSIRSKRLLDYPRNNNMEWRRFNNDSNEDTFITAHCWDIFAKQGMTKAPLEVAMEFGREADMPENMHITEPFVFHKWYFRNYIYPRF